MDVDLFRTGSELRLGAERNVVAKAETTHELLK
jgi:hypothetical protein